MYNMVMEPKPTKFVAVYGRVSTSNQEVQETIKTQLLAVGEFAAKNNMVIVKEYLDEGWSGDILARPALDQLRVDAKKSNWDAVLAYDPDRLARRGAWQEVVTEELQEKGIEVLYVTIPQATSDEDKIMQKMRGVFTEYERMKIKERFRLGKVRKAKEGHVITTEAPYGYTFILKRGKHGDTDFKQGHYVINQQEADVVRSIFNWVADEGLTLRAVVRKLQLLGVSPRKSKRGVWNTSTLSTMLRNKTYIGEAHYGASYAVVAENPLKKDVYRKNRKTSRRMRPEEDWIKIPTLKIIEEDLFKRANQRVRDNFALCPRNTKNEYLLSGRIFCPCGQRRAGEGPQKGKHLYYRCNNRVFSFPLPRTCFEKGINARIADKLVWNKIAELMSSPELMMKQVERWTSQQQLKNTSERDEPERIRKEILKLKDQERRYNMAYGSGVFDIETLKEYISPIRGKIRSLESEALEISQDMSIVKNEIVATKHDINAFAQKSIEALKDLSFAAKKGIISNVVEKVVGTQKELQVCGYIPIIIENYVEQFTDDGNGTSTTQHLYLKQNCIPFTFRIKLLE